MEFAEIKTQLANTGQLTIVAVSSSQSTTAVINGFLGNEDWEASGTAKVAPGDKHDYEVGEYLAVGRALEALGKKMIKQGLGREKCLVDNRNQSKEQKKLRRELNAAVASPTVRRRRFRRGKQASA